MKGVLFLFCLLLIISQNVLAQLRHPPNTNAYTFSYYVAGYWGESAILYQKAKINVIKVSRHGKEYVIRSPNFQINITKEELLEKSKYPDLYDRSFAFTGNAVIFYNPATKDMLGIKSKEYAAVEGRIYTSFSDGMYGLAFSYYNKDLKMSRSICLSATKELMDHSFKQLSEFLRKSYNMKDLKK